MLFPTSVTLLGPTASGNTAVAIEVARELKHLELVSVDSMTIYRELTIGTAKPAPSELVGIRYHLLGVVSVVNEYSLADYLRDCAVVSAEISARGSRALLVGGTALYLKAVLDDLRPPGTFSGLRSWLEQRATLPGGTACLYSLLKATDPASAALIEQNNSRRIVRSLEVGLGSGSRFSTFGPGVASPSSIARSIVGIDPGRVVLRQRIASRVEQQIESGWLQEAAALMDWDLKVSRTAEQALGYKELRSYLRGEITLEEAKERIVVRTYKFSKRQMAWFRRDSRIVWTKGPDEAKERISKEIAAVGEG